MNPLGVITGASSGIGKAYAYELAKNHDLILVARRKDLLVQISNELKKYRNKIKILVADLTNEKDLKRVESILSTIKVSILVNCAGFGDTDHFEDTSSTVINDMIYVHAFAPTRLSSVVLPGMIAQKGGVIINVASVAGFSKVNAGSLVYNSTKAYLIRFSELLQQEYNLKDIVKVQVLCPGYTKTAFFKNLKQNVKIPDFLWMNSEEVVKKSLRQIKSNKTVCIPGWYNIIIANIIGSFFFTPLLKVLNRNAEKRLGITF